MKIDLIWLDLQQNIVNQKIIYKRYDSNIAANILIGIEGESRKRWIGIGFNQKPILTRWSNLKDIKIENWSHLSNSNPYWLVVLLEHPDLNDIFSIVCSDLIGTIAPFTSEKAIRTELFNRLEQWQTLFEQYRTGGLSLEAQQGLFGELCFLKSLFGHVEASKAHSVLDSWVGVTGGAQDFKMADWAVEIKTTSPNNVSKIQVSNLQQFDNTGFHFLGLCHYVLDNQGVNGISLVALVTELETLCQHIAPDLEALFKHKLLQVGYFQSQKELYETRHYLVHQVNHYQIKEDFPCLTANKIAPAIVEAKYSIDLNACEAYRMHESRFFKKIHFL